MSYVPECYSVKNAIGNCTFAKKRDKKVGILHNSLWDSVSNIIARHAQKYFFIT